MLLYHVEWAVFSFFKSVFFLCYDYFYYATYSSSMFYTCSRRLTIFLYNQQVFAHSRWRRLREHNTYRQCFTARQHENNSHNQLFSPALSTEIKATLKAGN